MDGEDEDASPRLYTRRWFVLLSYGAVMFCWYAGASRPVPITQSFARYFGTTNEVNFKQPGFGVDFMYVLDNIVLLVTYFFGAYMIDRHGLRMMTLGAFAVMLTNWVWYFADDNIELVLLARSFTTVFAVGTSSALLAVSNRWFGEKERATATALGALLNLLGTGAALILGPLFATNPDLVIDLNLKSCDPSAETQAAVTAATPDANGFIPCTEGALEDAVEEFCCYLPVDIAGLNLFHAILGTVVFLFTLASVRDLPPTPPTPSAQDKEYLELLKGVKQLFTNPRFVKVAMSDFLVSGPVIVLFSSISRAFPAKVADLSFYAAAIGLVFAIPTSLLVAKKLDQSKRYWEYAAGGYTVGAAFWVLATIMVLINTDGTAYIFLGVATVAVIAYLVWQVAIFELKMEYAFIASHHLEGIVVATDKIIINASSLVFISAMPPERFDNLNLFYIIGAVIMVVGCVPVWIIKDRFTYVRHEFDQVSKKGAVVVPEAA